MKLSVLKNNVLLESYSFQENDSEDVYIGRSTDCHVVLDDHKISRHHILISCNGKSWKIKRLAESSDVLYQGKTFTEALILEESILELNNFKIIFSELPREEDVKLEATQFANNSPPKAAEVIEANLLKDAQTENVMDSEIKAQDEIVVSPAPEEDAERSQMIEDQISTDSTSGFEAESEGGNGDEVEGGEINFGDDNGQVESSNFEGEQTLDNDLSSDGSSAIGDGTAVISSFAKFSLKLFGTNIPYDNFMLELPETYIGRDPQKCQIVLDDPEVSSVHAVIKKNIVNCVITDLNSGNGTLLNGERINKAELRNGDEFIIGETTFTVMVESDLIDDESSRLMPVDENQEIIKEEIVEEEVDFDELSENSTEQDEKPKSLLKDPKKKKIVYAVVGLALLALLMDDEKPIEEEKTKKEEVNKSNRISDVSTTSTSSATQLQVNSKKNKIFTPEQLDFLESNYQVAKALFEQGKYSETLIELDKVKAIDQDYKESAQIYSLAKQGLARIEEAEKLRKQEEERRLREKKIGDLVEKAKVAVKERQSTVADSLFSQILELDPENIEVSQLKMEIEAYRKEQERIVKEKEKKETERKRQVSLLTPGKTFYLKNEWYKAIIKLEGFLINKDLDEDLIKEASDMLADAKTKLADQISPLMGKARSFREGQDFKGAYETYSEILKIDPTHEESLNEMSNIKDSLDMRSKKIYREAIISESLSLFEDAKEKFQEVQQISPSDSVYYKKATDKLKGYFE